MKPHTVRSLADIVCSTCYCFFFCAVVLAASANAQDKSAPDFGRDVRPILAKHCFACHGPDPGARQADLRFDTQSGSRSDLGGYQAVQPGAPEKSEIIARITSQDDDLRMPPSDKHPALSKREIDTLRRWIASGAEYAMHWAFVPPQKVNVPFDADDNWSRGPIDRFIYRKIKSSGLQPTAPANKTSLIRRLYIDLCGVTPSPEAVDRFVNNLRPTAYRDLVDELLATPEYAERFARPWLDLARYSDTNGYEKDRPRTIWPYRDWVIHAIATDMPFDQFSIEQLAGDMLPNATQSQRIATGFHRNTMMNEEGGIDPLEYRFYAMVDRVATTGTVWMGLTTGCAQCHTHKYDPITHTDYYSLMALMNNADEPEVNADDSITTRRRIRVQQQIQRQTDIIAAKTLDSKNPKHAELQQQYTDWKNQQIQSSQPWKIIAPKSATATTPQLQVTETGSILASGDVTKREVYTLTMPPLDLPATAIRLEVLPHETLPADGPGMAYYEGRRGDFFLSHFKVKRGKETIPLKDGSQSHGKISVGGGSATAANLLDDDGSTGWSTSDQPGKANRVVLNFVQPFQCSEPWQIEMLFERHFVAALGHFRIAVVHAAQADEAAKASAHEHAMETRLSQVRSGAKKLSADDETYLRRHFVQTHKGFAEARKTINAIAKTMPKPVRSLGLRERPAANKRKTHRHHRGEYLQAREQVLPAVPELFDSIEGPANRLTLARWLVSDKNPLVGRVVANSAWREFFGHGIVRTAGDFGTQSEPPSHPQLIDWLDQQLRSGWSLKRLHREIVLSSTYQQSVAAAPAVDPNNRLLSCFPYRRYDAERIRDIMLSASGMLSRQVGGPSVYPPQPASVVQVAYGNSRWNPSQGADRFRRSLYTFSKRTAPFAAFTTFDGPSGESCVARRDSSTTPLQALTLMNDAMFVEIARGLADNAIRELGPSAANAEIASRIFRRLLTRSPEKAELNAMMDFFQSQAKHKEPWMLVARALMNTDEAITTP